MRDFNDHDRKKKSGRIRLPDNPGNLSEDLLLQLEAAVKAALKDGYVPCPSGWRIAKDAGVSRLDVGAAIDRLGIRVTDCLLGCFKVSKTAYDGVTDEPLSEEVVRRVTALGEKGELTCAVAFELAGELNVRPLSVADAANARGYKIRQCQLGCF